MDWQAIAAFISAAIVKPVIITAVKSVGGGDINAAYKLDTNHGSYFIKLNQAQLNTMFAAESAGLNELAASATVTVPKPITFGVSGQHAFLVLEYIPLTRLNSQSARVLGRQLALLHDIPQPYFGWYQDNTIGSTRQINYKNSNWVDFWQQYRLGFQLHLAAKNGYSSKLQSLGQKLLVKLPALFSSYQVKPSLLHGDLWAGNAAMDASGNPVFFDPACYYGDREADLAMTELFGGFSADFYSAYHEIYPLDKGYKNA
ncbi:fructosamine kinase family protein [Methylocucumis oryzae]|uniref:fructosamine kinase family protein n=1 Tax=Methylocucumis oryzae TaxID=1632867 RepID=UPI0023BAC140|nr:fructosamine kinase family protein [Methylocucumis oryzae]